MPGLAAERNNHQLLTNEFWSKNRDELSYNQLQKFWSELSPQSRQDLLKIDKQTLLEQARKNMYCSRCNGLLLEGFTQIISGKSLQPQGAGGQLPHNRSGISKDQMHDRPGTTPVRQYKAQDPSVHPWRALTPTRDGALTLLDCYLSSKSLKGLQNVFDSARARESERESLYPDACGGGGRVWMSQGIASYGRGHGTRERCALHTARLSCDTLVDFWSTLGEEMRQSLFRMKEEDFIERLMHRFDSKRFCKDCRRNVIREFKELKELKRMRREPRCTSWFCGADTDFFQYEVSNDTIRADWHQLLIDSVGTYHHLEWAVGSGKGKSDILEFENVGMKGSVQVNGLDLGGLNACYITLRAWRRDGRCTEFSVKAHALKGRQCVHCRLEVGDGYVKVTCGESIRRFFEHAEEVEEEEEDDDSVDKDGNDMNGEGSRPQKHAKSPELAREFLLEAATVIFKEQVEKAFREGTARQNAHSILVCLALKLLEERIHVACKEIVTLEKQMKLLQEEEKEKREEEERKERKKTKEREKKLRRKERLRGKDQDKKCNGSSQTPLRPDSMEVVLSPCLDEEANNSSRDSVSENSDTPGVHDESSPNDYTAYDFSNNGLDGTDGKLDDVKEGNGFLSLNDSLHGSHQKSKLQRDLQLEISCGCDHPIDYREKVEPHSSLTRFSRVKTNAQDNFGRHGGKILNYSSNTLGRDLPHTEKVIEVCPHDISKNLDGNTLLDNNTSSKSRVDGRFQNDFHSEVDVTPTSYDHLNGTSDFSATSGSSSDNCSSCLSEDDGNTPFSSHPSMESSSTSDSDESTQQSEGRASSVCVQKGLYKAHDIEKEKTKNIKVGEEGADLTQSSSFSSQKVGNHLTWNCPIKTPSQNTEEANCAPCILPPFHNPNMSFPSFQDATSSGYYHQTPMAWSTAPRNGFVTYPHPNHYLSASPFGYGPSCSGSPFCMQYGPVKHLASYFTSPNQIPVYQQAPKSNCLDPQEQTNALKAKGLRYPLGESRTEKVAPIGCDPKKEKENLTKSGPGNTGFSLFQFGGPVPTYRSNLQSSDEGKSGYISCCHVEVEGGHTCSKEETRVGEYNLFAKSNGIQFSIF